MGLFGRKKKDLTLDGIGGTAVVEWLEDASYDADDESTSLADLGIGNVKRGMRLKVSVEGQPEYLIEGKQKIPAKRSAQLAETMRLPVYVDRADPQHIDINWEAFDASGEQARVLPQNTQQIREHVHQAMDASRETMINGWVMAVQQGALTPEAFEEALQGSVTSGMLTEDEAAAARARINQSGSR